MVVSKKESSRYESQIGDLKIKQVQKFDYLESVLIDYSKYDTESQKPEIVTDAFQKLN